MGGRLSRDGGGVMVNLYTFVPYDAACNLGRAYNRHMALLPEGAWAVLLDHDVALLTLDWWHVIQRAIATKPDAGVFTCLTNRIAAPWQQVGDRDNHEMGYHLNLARERAAHQTLLDITESKGFGGVLMALSKAAWQRVGGFVDGMFCVDHNLHFALVTQGYRNYLIESLYVYHRRRAFGVGLSEVGPQAPQKAPCQCRGHERTPTVRVPMVTEAVVAC